MQTQRKQRPITGQEVETRERIPGTNLYRTPKGSRNGGGREKGVQNKITTTVKEALSLAMDKSGFDGKGKDGMVGYLTWLSRAEPVAFTTLIKSVIPLQLQGNLNINNTNQQNAGQQEMGLKEFEKVLAERGIRVPSLIDVTPLPVRPMKTIEGK